MADFQAQGRGTNGREWHASPGSCLMFTIIARPVMEPTRLPDLPLAVAHSVAAFLSHRFRLDATVSPPNDIHVNGRKICGILCTSRVTGERVDWLLCGIGLNTFMTSGQLPVSDATSMAVEGLDDIPVHEQLLPELLHSLRWLLTDESPSCAENADKPIL